MAWVTRRLPLNLRIEPEWVRTNDVLAKEKRRWDRRRRRPKNEDDDENAGRRRPPVDELTVDVVA